ncbi:hypothetical protein ABT150_18285 [Streptomyces mirabilis]|uniref:hypothetical protein n=1 Tax=Streptomyces mirabilis TaxID=68239 RepID=UPI00331D9C1B
MGFFDKLTGTRYPDSGVVLLSAMELRAGLLALNGPDVPFCVRNALPAAKASRRPSVPRSYVHWRETVVDRPQPYPRDKLRTSPRRFVSTRGR